MSFIANQCIHFSDFLHEITAAWKAENWVEFSFVKLCFFREGIFESKTSQMGSKLGF